MQAVCIINMQWKIACIRQSCVFMAIDRLTRIETCPLSLYDRMRKMGHPAKSTAMLFFISPDRSFFPRNFDIFLRRSVE